MKTTDDEWIEELEDGRKVKFIYQELRNQAVKAPFLIGSVGSGLPDLMVTEWY